MKRALFVALLIAACGSADFDADCETITSDPGAGGVIVKDGNAHNILGQDAEVVVCAEDSSDGSEG